MALKVVPEAVFPPPASELTGPVLVFENPNKTLGGTLAAETLYFAHP